MRMVELQELLETEVTRRGLSHKIGDLPDLIMNIIALCYLLASTMPKRWPELWEELLETAR